MALEPERIGPYELAEELGSGGMGTVYRAADTRNGQTVALKVMDSRLARDPDYVRRFQREAEIAKKLDSPHIVRVLDSGQDGNQHYLVMEYVEGKNLTEVLRERGKLPPEEARSIATQVALALEAAHANGVVHRDIKPGNILIDEHRTAKVTDFGIARAADSTTITKTGLFLGTLSYAAPELLAGKADIRSDIYSLGVVLYQMLAGRVPFESDTPLALMDMHRSQEPPTLESLGVRVPGDLRAIVARCLAKRPQERYRSPAELTAALEGRALPGAAVPAGAAGGEAPPITPTRMWSGADWFGRGRLTYVLLGAGIAGVVLAAVIVGLAATGGADNAGDEQARAPAVTDLQTAAPLPTTTRGAGVWPTVGAAPSTSMPKSAGAHQPAPSTERPPPGTQRPTLAAQPSPWGAQQPTPLPQQAPTSMTPPTEAPPPTVPPTVVPPPTVPPTVVPPPTVPPAAPTPTSPPPIPETFTIWLDQASYSAAVGSSFHVRVLAGSLANSISKYALGIPYDTYLRIVATEPDNPTPCKWGLPAMAFDWYEPNISGLLLGCGVQPASPAQSGTVELLDITFRCEAPGTGVLAIAHRSVLDADGRDYHASSGSNANVHCY